MKGGFASAAVLMAAISPAAPDAASGQDGRSRDGFNESPHQRRAFRVAMPGQRDVPCGLRHAKLVEPDSRDTHQRGRSRDERDAKTSTDQRDDREKLVRLLRDPRREARRRADAQHVVVEAGRPGPRDDDERFGRRRAQAGARVPSAVRADRRDQALVQDMPQVKPVVDVSMTDEATSISPLTSAPI
jgi:hypothetical protein